MLLYTPFVFILASYLSFYFRRQVTAFWLSGGVCSGLTREGIHFCFKLWSGQWNKSV